MNEYKKKVIVKYADRIDKYLNNNTNFSRSNVQKLIKIKAIYVNNLLIIKNNFRIKINDIILITKKIIKQINIKKENIPLDVVYEDEDIIIINKSSGMVTHPAPGNYSKTLVNALLYRFKQLSNINGSIRPGIIHRIDKHTSGLLVIAKNNLAHQFLINTLKNHSIKRTYYALVQGKMENKITHINLPIGRDIKNRQKMCVTKFNAKNAITHIFLEKILGNTSFVRCELETGRTHQIRVHLSYIKHPIVGDYKYGGKKIDEFNQRLHAFKLEIIHPKTKKSMIFQSQLPKEFNL